MKWQLCVLFILFSFVSMSQKKAISEDGINVILYPDRTWKPESEVKDLGTTSNIDTSKIFISLSSYSSVISDPKLPYSSIDDFPKKNIEVIDLIDGYFVVKNKDGRMGYVNKYFVDNHEQKSQEIIGKIVSEAVSKNKKTLIRNIKIEEVNSADGVDFSIEWINANTKKIIKYAYFSVVPYNAVGDIQSCKIRRQSEFTGKVTGPINPDSKLQTSYWETAWYNSSINCIKLTKVEIIYMDGSTDIYIKDLPTIIDRTLKNKCN